MITKFNAQNLFARLEGLVHEYPEAVGIGEVGLDLTTECRHGQRHNPQQCLIGKIQGQRQFLRLSLQLAKRLSKVLVLHVRDEGSGKAALEVLALLQELDMTDHPIHRHCFVGGEEEYRQWCSSLPNCYFSISPQTIKNAKTVSALRAMDNRKRLILETDSPYLAFYPWCVNAVAEGAARHLEMTKAELVGVCNRNAARLYSLPW